MDQYAFNFYCSNGKLLEVQTACQQRKLWDKKRVDLQQGFILACAHGQLCIVKLLTEFGVKDHARGIEEACQNNYQHVFEYLVEQNKYYKNHASHHKIRIDNDYVIALHYINGAIKGACTGGHIDLLHAILKRTLYEGEQDDRILESLGNGFIQACIGGNLNMIIEIHTLFANYVEYDHYNDGFASACEKGHMDVVEFFAKNDPPDAVDWGDGLLLACQHGHADIVRKHIDRIVQIEEEYNNLMVDACCGNNIELVKFLVDRGANDFNSGLRTALLKGSYGDQVVALMIELGATDWSYAFFVDWHFYDDVDDDNDEVPYIADMILTRLNQQGRFLTNSEKIDLYVSTVGHDVIAENIKCANEDGHNDIVELILKHYQDRKWTLSQEVLETLLIEITFENESNIATMLLDMGAKRYENLFNSACYCFHLKSVQMLIKRFRFSITRGILSNSLQNILRCDRLNNNLSTIDPRKFQLIAYLLYVGAKFPQYYCADELVPPLTNRRLVPITKNHPVRTIDDNIKMVQQRFTTQKSTYNVMNCFVCDDIMVFMCCFMGVPHFMRVE